tara:strand:- start:839 stop:994 length:156 start_codon:yes stop_codon:yes gene_type:complete
LNLKLSGCKFIEKKIMNEAKRDLIGLNARYFEKHESEKEMTSLIMHLIVTL